MAHAATPFTDDQPRPSTGSCTSQEKQGVNTYSFSVWCVLWPAYSSVMLLFLKGKKKSSIISIHLFHCMLNCTALPLLVACLVALSMCLARSSCCLSQYVLFLRSYATCSHYRPILIQPNHVVLSRFLKSKCTDSAREFLVLLWQCDASNIVQKIGWDTIRPGYTNENSRF